MRRLALAAVVVLVAACQGATGPVPSATSGAGLTAPAATAPATAAPTEIEATAVPATPAREPCIVDTGNPMSEMTAGRCLVTSFQPRFFFDAPADWGFSGQDGQLLFLWPDDSIPDDGEPLNLVFYRYGGSVTRTGCDDPDDRLSLDTAAEIVAWLETLDGLDANVEERLVEGRPAWLINLIVPEPPACIIDGEHGLQLWTIDGPDDRVFALGEGRTYRFYLIDTSSEVVFMAVQYWDLVNTEPYFEAAEAIFQSLSFE